MTMAEQPLIVDAEQNFTVPYVEAAASAERAAAFRGSQLQGAKMALSHLEAWQESSTTVVALIAK